MSLLLTINPNPQTEPEASKAAPDRLVAGDPSFLTWALDSSRNGEVRTGIWEATPGETISIKGETFEFCHILEGVIELTEDGKEPVVYRKGDSFIMKPGYRGIWKTIETVRKIYVIVG
ncbi:cupin domain-containing protein [Pseudochelatococcus contaminans]|uniref:(S)-ureidoglycine aminohydrolase cupin domain-containing protein n=1 Tax=Pseudochelatococcus contaminans TaxID=1538103 RepID=A0A7W5Z5T9_9HYPH|nr:cupin domain-containing protein [Pseudochelatococcus contaminans]MBB3810554.1 hypothetical protein [Pseudochelatococcus contaminans]